MIITVTMIIGVSVVGLFMIDINPTGAQTHGQAIENANQTEATTQAPTASGYDMTTAVVKMLAALALVILTVYAALFLLKKVTGKKLGRGSQGDLLEVLQTAYVGPHKAISLVKYCSCKKKS